MTAATLSETELTPELIERVMKLSRENMGRLIGIAFNHLEGPPEDPEAVQLAWKNELTKRIHEIESGSVQLVDGRESLARMRHQLREKYGV